MIVAQEFVHCRAVVEDDKAETTMIVRGLGSVASRCRWPVMLQPGLFDGSMVAEDFKQSVLRDILWNATHEHFPDL